MKGQTDIQSRSEVLRRLGPIPFWRGEEKCLPSLEGIYRKAMTKAKEVLNREDTRAGKSAS